MIGSKLTISSVKYKMPLLHTFTDAKGYTNSYVLKPQNKAKRKSKKPVVLSNLELENVSGISEDAIKNKRYEVRINDADIRYAFKRFKILYNSLMKMFCARTWL